MIEDAVRCRLKSMVKTSKDPSPQYSIPEWVVLQTTDIQLGLMRNLPREEAAYQQVLKTLELFQGKYGKTASCLRSTNGIIEGYKAWALESQKRKDNNSNEDSRPEKKRRRLPWK